MPSTNSAAAAANHLVFSCQSFSRRMRAGSSELLTFPSPIA